MPTIEEKRVYAEKTGKTEVYVASGAGVVVVDVSEDLVGGFSLERPCSARDVAAGSGAGAGDVALATDEDVAVLAAGEFVATGFGPATAVGFDGGDLLAAGEDGRLARLAAGGEAAETGDPLSGREWTEIDTVEAEVRAIDGQFVATEAGLYRVTGDGQELVDAGLGTVNDVSATGTPLAATGDGLYKLGNGWMEVLPGDFRVVAADGDRAHAASGAALYAGESDWDRVDLQLSEPIRGLGYTPNVAVAVTEAGRLLIESGDEWRGRSLGVGDVVGLAVR